MCLMSTGPNMSRPALTGTPLVLYILLSKNTGRTVPQDNCWSSHGHLYTTANIYKPSCCCNNKPTSNSPKHSYNCTWYNKRGTPNRCRYNSFTSYSCDAKHNGYNFYRPPSSNNSSKHAKYSNAY
ncbi:Hypp8987 [Branchiostoma lanceolatum]|uniref:Hypp8987 protein n=1 Tax=Branchiostoma lanceolatum TaxID=7740 RepID=A0A8K0EJY3_BRALA|nr:Hypp8987 [Branchiostoma lanceolatum]